jgi:hypothetical protein
MWRFYFWREDEADGQDFILGAGAQFWPSRNLWMVIICESLRESSAWRVGQVLPLQGVYRFKLSRHSQLWVAACRRSHLIVCLVYCWWIRGVGYGYGHDYITIIIIVFYLPLTLTCVNVLLVLVRRSKYSTWLKLKMAKIIKTKDQRLVVESSVPTNP